MKKIISIILALTMVLTIIACSAAMVQATTYIYYGEWMLAVNSDTTYLLGGYIGSETSLVFPETANDKAIIGVAEDFSENCDSEIVSVAMPDSYTTVETYAFYDCSTLTTIEFSPNLTEIGSMAFGNCTALDNVNLSVSEGLDSIPYGCFSGCSNLSSIQFPDGLAAISDYAFSKTALQNLDFPESVTNIGSYSFNSCKLLGALELPVGIETIGDGAFYECSSLSNVTIPNGLKTIGAYAFYNDVALTSVYIPVSVSSIGAYAFNPMGIEGGTLTLDCYEGTYAASYAYENYISFTGDKLVKGDINNDGKTTIRDVTYIQLYRADLYNIPNDAKSIDKNDVTGDYEVTLRDATQIQLFLAQLIDSL